MKHSLSVLFALALVRSATGQCELQPIVHVTEASPYGPQAMLGTALAIDGERFVTGAPAEGALGEGAVLVYERSAGAWTEVARLLAAPPPGTFDSRVFGAAVDLEGVRVLVGAPGQRSGTLPGVGAAYLFERGPFGWRSVFGFAPSAPHESIAFGSAVELSGDTAFIGAPNDGFPALDGAVQVFRRSPTGLWTVAQTLRTPRGGGRFGSDLALDDGVLLVGAPSTGDPGDLGTVYAFEEVAGQWVQTQEILPPAGFRARLFGQSVAIDGTRALVGAPGATELSPGAVFVYERGPSGWTLVQELAPRVAESLYFGTDVALRGDVAAVGASGDDSAGVHEAGTAWLFARTPAGWQERGRIGDPAPSEYDLCGSSIAVGRDGTVLVGIPGDLVDGRVQKGSVLAWQGTSAGCTTLSGAPERLSLARGGVHELLLQAPPAAAGDEYVLLASERGTAPGIRLSTGRLPLNPGALLTLSLHAPNLPPFANSRGQLDASATARASFSVPPLSSAALVGLRLHFAFLTFHSGLVLPPSGVSNASPLEFRP